METDQPPEHLGVGEAKKRFSELIDRVGRGERFVVARRGKPALALVPPDDLDGDHRPAPVGLLAFVGALAEWDDLDEFIEEIYASRRRERGRRVPTID